MADEFISAGRPLRRILKATPLAGRNAQVVWNSGESQVVDLMPALASHRAFVQLRTDDALFGTLRASDEQDSVLWANGLELSAAWIEEIADAPLDNADFRDAMDRLHLTLDGMAARLGVARRLVADYRKDKPIPKHIALATRYLLERKAG